MIDKIRNEVQYRQILALIENFIVKATQNGGFAALSDEEKTELSQLSILAENFEDNVLHIMPLNVTINTVVQHKIKELNLTQAKLAAMLGLGSSKLSQILNGKREPDVRFLKAVHEN